MKIKYIIYILLIFNLDYLYSGEIDSNSKTYPQKIIYLDLFSNTWSLFNFNYESLVYTEKNNEPLIKSYIKLGLGFDFFSALTFRSSLLIQQNLILIKGNHNLELGIGFFYTYPFRNQDSYVYNILEGYFLTTTIAYRHQYIGNYGDKSFFKIGIAPSYSFISKKTYFFPSIGFYLYMFD